MRLLVVLTLSLFFVACPKNGEQPVAVVNGSPIGRDAFETELQRVKAEIGEAKVPDKLLKTMKASVLNELIDRKLILDAAQEYDVAVSEPEVMSVWTAYQQDFPEGGFDKAAKENFVNVPQLKQRVRDSILMEKVVDKAVGGAIQPDREELERFYEKHAGDYTLEERIHLFQIVVRTREEAEALRARLKNGETFAELAKKHSLTPEAKDGGDLGVFARGEMPPEFNHAFSLAPKQLSTVVESSYGYHLFWVKEKLPAKIPSFQDVEARVRARFMADRRENAYRSWIAHLREKAEIQIFQDEVERFQ